MRRENAFDEKAVNEVLEAWDKDHNGKPVPTWDTIKEERGERLVNPLITLKDCDTSYGVIVDQYTGKSMNSNTYFDNILDVHRNRAKMFENKEGLEYNIMSADATDPAAVYVLFDHNVNNLFKAIIDSLYTDLRASLYSSAAYIFNIVRSYLDKRYGSYFITKKSADSIISKMNLIDEISAVPVTMEKITPEWLFSYGANVKMTVMTEFCKVVYEAIQEWVYNDFAHQKSFNSTVEVTDGHVNIKSGIYDYKAEIPKEGQYVTYKKPEPVLVPGLTLDMVYRDVCTIIYPQLELIDASLAAILVAHVEKAASCYSDYIKLYEEATRNLNDKED